MVTPSQSFISEPIKLHYKLSSPSEHGLFEKGDYLPFLCPCTVSSAWHVTRHHITDWNKWCTERNWMDGKPSLLNSEEEISGPATWTHSQKAKWGASPCPRLRIRAAFLIHGLCPLEPCSGEAAKADAMSLASVQFPRWSPTMPATQGHPCQHRGWSGRQHRKMDTKAGEPRRSLNQPSVLQIKKGPISQ